MKSESASLPSSPSKRIVASRTFVVGLGLSLLLNLAAVLYQLHIIAPGRPSYSTSLRPALRTHCPLTAHAR